MEEMEEAGWQKETKKFYRKVNIIRKGYKPRIWMCKDRKGNLVTEKRSITEMGRTLELLSGHRDEDGNKGDDVDGETETEDTRESLDKE